MENNQNPNDEIDLLELFRIISRKFNQVFNWLNSLLKFAFKNSIVLIIILSIGVAVGYFYKNSTDKVYSSEVVLQSNYVSNAVVSQLIISVEEAVEDENELFFSENSLSVSQKHLDEIEFMTISKDDDSLKNREPFLLKLNSTSGTVLPKLQSEIIEYISANSYVKLKSEQNNSSKLKRLDELTKEIESLDSLKDVLKTIEEVRTVSGKSGVIPYIDPTAVSQEQQKLINERIKLEVSLMDQEIIRVISPALAKNKPDLSEKKSGAIFGIVLAFLAFVGIYRNRDSWKWVRV